MTPASLVTLLDHHLPTLTGYYFPTAPTTSLPPCSQ